ncbi:MAG: ATP-binding cassette domain-containing protein [Aggregatilineaceae bacterium]
MAASEYVIETRGLVKRYGKLTAVNDLWVQVPRGAIYGFVGPNGAGKTTTMRILATLIPPTAGDAFIDGYSVTKHPREVRRRIGYMPDFFGVYDDMKVWEYLDFFAACYEIPARDRPALIDDLLALVDLTHRRDDMVEKLSRGMKQRLSLARTLAHDPQVLILDEPASGLDPRARIEVRELLVEMARMGKTIFFSSHILADVAEICTHLGIIEAGSLVAQGTVEEIRRQLLPVREITVTLLDRIEEAKEVLAQIAGVGQVRELTAEAGRKRLRVDFSGDDLALSELLQALARRGLPVVSFSEEMRDLESVFMRATRGIVS